MDYNIIFRWKTQRIMPNFSKVRGERNGIGNIPDHKPTTKEA